MQVTFTLDQPTSTVLKLKGQSSKDPIADRLDVIVKELQEMEVFGLEEKAYINAWIIESSTVFAHGDNISEKLGALIQLAADIVEPKFLVESSESVLLALFKIDGKIKDLMKSYLPSGKSSEAIIEAYQLKSRKVVKVEVSKPALGEKLSAVLYRMLQSPYFSSEEKVLITVWVNTLPPQFFNMLKGENSSQLASIGLCYLLCKLLHPAMLRAKHEQEKTALKVLIKELKEVLRLSMPEGENPEEFIKTYQDYDRQAELFTQKQLIAKQCGIIARKQVCDEANAMKDKIAMNSEKNKLLLLDFSASRRSMGNTACEKTLSSTGQIGAMIEKMKENENQMIAVADNMEACHLQFQENTRNCKNMLDKL